MALPPETVFISTTPGLEPALEAEARALWSTAVRAVPGGFEVQGERGLHQQACLSLRTASQVLLRIASAPVRSAQEVRAAIGRVDLRPFGGAIALELSAKNAAPNLRQAAEAAIRERAAPQGATRALVRLDDQGLTVSLDAAGEPLYRRGYRQEISRAPMRETLAAGMLVLARYDGEQPLWDPLCGSGTLLIEGAWLAARRAPGLTRRFAFETWPSFSQAEYDARTRALKAAERPPPAAILGTDLNAGSLGVARRNARRAGVFDALKLERRDALAISAPPELSPGLVAANLPYGKRVGADQELIGFHRSLGAALNRGLAGWRAILLTGSDRFADALGLHELQRWTVDNGGIRCALILAQLGG